jgi:hypothetical protein
MKIKNLTEYALFFNLKNTLKTSAKRFGLQKNASYNGGTGKG